MNYFFIAIAFLVAVFMGWIITPQILLVAFRKRLFDSVGGRKTHSGIVPRLGGVVFVPVQCFLLVLSMFFMYKLEITSYLQDPFIPFQFLLLMIGLLILNMVGVIDDLIRNNPLIKPFSEGAIVVSFATLIVPLFDVVRVVRIRYFQHKPLFMPDQNHIHHKFLRVGMSHYVAMILILALALFFSFFNIVAVEYISNNIVIFIDIVLWIAFHLWLDRRELIRAKHGVANN